MNYMAIVNNPIQIHMPFDFPLFFCFTLYPGSFSEPIVTSTGCLLAIRNGQSIRVYKKTPFTTVLSSLDMSLSSSK